MKIVIAPDSFKESLSAMEVAEAIEEGLRRIWPAAAILKVPMADGGEGSMQIIAKALQAEIRQVRVSGPLGCPLEAQFAIIPATSTAIIEMAAASGLTLLNPCQRNPMQASTFGTGELILAALDAGCQTIYIGLGGSATVDGGMGALEALGLKFYDHRGARLKPSGRSLCQIDRVDASELDPRLKGKKIILFCDVDNPLLGPQGAVYMYASQKGATTDQLEPLEAGMQVWATHLPAAVIRLPGSGAAGGLAAGLLAFLEAEMKKGIEVVAELVALDRALEGADLVITGEGAINRQSAHGKTPVGIAMRAKCPVIALSGELGAGYRSVYEKGISVCWPIESGPCSKAEALEAAKANLTDTAERLAKTLQIGMHQINRP